MTISEIARWALEQNDFALMAHVRPDGDSLGCTLGLKLALEQLGKRAVVVYPGEIPEMYRFLPGTDAIVDETNLPFVPQAVIAVDVARADRMGRAGEVFEACANRAVVDHHEVFDCAEPRHHIRPEAAACGELVYELICEMGVVMTTDIADCLYTAMSTDTGNFNFSNTTANTLRCSAACIEAGVNVSELTRRLFRLRKKGKVKLLGMCLNGIEYFEDGRLSLVKITDEMLAEAGAARSDSEGVVNFQLETEGVQVAILAQQISGGTKFSFRSLGHIDVAALSRELGGGGHARASGATMMLPMDEAVAQVLEVFLPAVR